MTEGDRMQVLPEGAVRQDREFEAAAESASEALARHRWHWTVDESNPERVSLRAYARAVGRSDRLIRKYAHGYVLFAQGADGTVRTIVDAIERASMAAEKQAVVEAVALANGLTFSTVRRQHKEEVREVSNAIERETERREEKGKTFDDDERADYARKVAETKKRTREREAREREAFRRNHGWAFLEADALFGKSRRAAKEGFDVVSGVEFTEEERDLLTAELVAAQTMIRLAMLRIAGDSGTDWDEELAKLEEKRQWG